MSLRPRYSLLTLLVLTALVAGGVKLWYGPHHVVERVTPVKELEYTFTREWNGKRTIHGPLIRRYFSDQVLYHVELEYHDSGVDTFRRHWIYVDHQKKKFKPVKQPLDPFNNRTISELLPLEPLEFQSAIELEYNHLRKRGYSIDSDVLQLGSELLK